MKMALLLAVTLLRRRPTLLTDLLEAPVELKHWVFDRLGVLEGVHDWCPHFCPCAVELDLDDEAYEAAAAAPACDGLCLPGLAHQGCPKHLPASA